MKVKECMCNSVCCAKPDTQITEIAKMMSQNHVGCVPVCDNDNCICGVLTDRDIILRTVACGKDPCNTCASEIMTTNVCTCKQEEEISKAETKMSQNKVRRLPVCDDNNRVIGILTMGDIAQNDAPKNEINVGETMGNICECGCKKNAE